MRSILPAERFAPFDAATAEAMSVAFDRAWEAILFQEQETAAFARTERTREALALRIIALAQGGERDVIRLSQEAVEYVLKASRK